MEYADLKGVLLQLAYELNFHGHGASFSCAPFIAANKINITMKFELSFDNNL